jgi:hypothetical protein
VKICVFSAGAIGGYVAAQLWHTGDDVGMVAWRSRHQGGAIAIRTFPAQRNHLDRTPGLDPQARHEMAATLRNVSETFTEVPDGRTASRVLGVLAHLLESGLGRIPPVPK